MERKIKYRVVNSASDPYITVGGWVTSNDFWRFGRDNLFPYSISALNRKSAAHRGILQSKVRYIAGKGITCDQKEKWLSVWINACNALGESLQDVARKIIWDKKAFGNAYIEIVTNARRSFLNIYHQDATKCRLSKDKKHIFLHHDWRTGGASKADRKSLPIYPVFEDTEKDGLLRSIIHIKEYEPEFENYGLMEWVAGLNVSAIAYKTDIWNVSRLDNSFNSSGVLVVAGEFESDEDFEDFKDEFEEEFVGEGKPGKILMLAQRPGTEPDAGTRFIPVNQSTEGDWAELHNQSTTDLVIAHGWFRSLAGIADNTGFDTQRILNEYEVALNTVIIDEQKGFLSVIQRILKDLVRVESDTLAFINRPPATAKPPYMMIWEARKADGLDYDESDPKQQIYLANISQPKSVTIQ